jgi:hypothetical protein
MVTNFTANEIGDVIMARLSEPYANVIRILDYDVIVGVTPPNAVGTLTFTNGSKAVVCTHVCLGAPFNLVSGDQFIVGNQTYTVDQIIDAYNFTMIETATFSAAGLRFYQLPGLNNDFMYEYRWSQAAQHTDGGEMSELRPLNKNLTPGTLLSLDFDPDKPLWLDLKLTVDKLSQGRKLTLLSVNYQLETAAGTIISCPQFCVDCTEPYTFDGCANIVICEAPVYDPYKLKKPSAIYRQLSNLSTEIWGHTVKYFRVEPDQRSRDVILMEYSLYNVVEQSEFKVMVPGNEFPTQQFNYDIFGMGFEEFEIHITKAQFQDAFGIGPSPRSRDYLYFPLINRMYEVNTVAYADEFNLDLTYWKVMLKKYEERTSSIISDTEIEQDLDALTVGMDEIFGEEINDEYKKVTKPQQYQTVYKEVADGIRLRMHDKLQIVDAQIRNRWTVISKNHYDLNSSGDTGMELIVYNKNSELSIRDNIGFTAWFRPKFTDNTDQLIVDAWNLGEGLQIITTPTAVKIRLNGDLHTFSYPVALTNATWYGLVFNLNNTYQEISVHLYKLDPDSNRLNSNNNTQTLTPFMSDVKSFANYYAWTLDKKWTLMPAKMDLTNLRLFKKTINQDQHMNILQQNVVRDAHLAHIIDNAVPSIGLRKYNSPR